MNRLYTQSSIPKANFALAGLILASVALVLLCIWAVQNQSLLFSQASQQSVPANTVVSDVRLAEERLAARKLAEQSLAAERRAREELMTELQAVEDQLATEKLAVAQLVEEKAKVQSIVDEKLDAENLAQQALLAEQMAAEKTALENLETAKRLTAEKDASEKLIAKAVEAEKQLAQERQASEKLLAENRETEKRLAAERLSEQRLAEATIEAEQLAAKANEDARSTKVAERAAARRAARAEAARAESLAQAERARQARVEARRLAAEERALNANSLLIAPRPVISAQTGLAEVRPVEPRSVSSGLTEPQVIDASMPEVGSSPSRRETSFERLRREELSVLPGLSGQLQFLPRADELTDATKRSLDRIFELLFLYSELRVIVEVASNEYVSDLENQKISDRRAQALTSYLIDRGLSSSRFTTSALGGQGLPGSEHLVNVSTAVINK